MLKILNKLHFLEFLNDDIAPLTIEPLDIFDLLDHKSIRSKLNPSELSLIDKVVYKKDIILKLLDKPQDKALDKEELTLYKFCERISSNHKLLFPKLKILKHGNDILKAEILNLSEILSKINSNKDSLSIKELLSLCVKTSDFFKEHRDLNLEIVLKCFASKIFVNVDKYLDDFQKEQYCLYLAFLHFKALKDKDYLKHRLIERAHTAYLADKKEIHNGEEQLLKIYDRSNKINLINKKDLGAWLNFMMLYGRFYFSAKEQLWICDCYTTYLLEKNKITKEKVDFTNRKKAILNFFDYLKIKEMFHI